MPPMNQTLEKTGILRMLCYGAPMTRKTWWALRAAEAGFNVIYADLDGGHHIATNLSPEAQGRIYHLDMRAPVDGFDNSGAHVLAHAMHGNPVLFDEELRKYVSASKADPEKTYVRIDLTKLTDRDILVIDSWSAMVQTLAESSVKIINPVSVSKLEWDNYGAVGLVLDHFIAGLKRLNCHSVVIGHAETYAKRKPDADPKAKPNEAIEQIRIQPASSSRPHGEKLARNFTDVLFFTVGNSMTGTYIDLRGSSDFDAGSRRMAPAKYKWDDVDITKFVPAASIPHDNKTFSTAGLVQITGAELAAEKAAVAGQSKINVGAKPAGILNRIAGQ